MKNPIWIAVVSMIIIVALVGSIYYFSSSSILDNTEFQLEVDNLKASTEGKVSFAVSLNKGESDILDSVILNDTRYSWSDGSVEDPTILNGETKLWSIDIGNLVNGSSIQVVVETSKTTSDDKVIVKSPTSNEPNYVYDNYGGVGLFDEGIHILATSQDPCMMADDFLDISDYWKMLKENETTVATDQDFITILLSRGDKPTGGYSINIESFGWLESYPVKFRFRVNFTDPGEGMIVTEALTNPIVLVPIGKLSAGEYNIEVNVTWFIENVDEEGNIYYTPVMTFAPIIWKESLTIERTGDQVSSTTFSLILNGNTSPALTVNIDLTDGLTKEEAKQIVESSFIEALGDRVLRRLDNMNYDNKQITAHYTWGYDENDLGHILDIKANLEKLEINVDHCR
ncbi:MAG: protease complex subunit PrcB family protein [Candidatus Bathyarchaeota archaeon]